MSTVQGDTNLHTTAASQRQRSVFDGLAFTTYGRQGRCEKGDGASAAEVPK
jgi:hypothetical protein